MKKILFAATVLCMMGCQNKPTNSTPALDPSKVDLGTKIPTLPAFDPTGTLSGLTFADPGYWNGHEAEWSKTFGRVQKGY